MYKAIILFLFFFGILLVSISLSETKEKFDMPISQLNPESIIEPIPKFEYRYIPRTFEDEQFNPVYPSEIFETMFSQPSPWILSIREYDQRKQEKINQYFVSQL